MDAAMKKTIFFALIAMAGVFFSARWFTQAMLAPPVAESAVADPTHLRIGAEFLDRLDGGHYTQALELLAPALRQSLDEARLKQVWEGLPEQFGERRARDALRGEAIKGTPLVTARLQYGSTALDARITINADGLVEDFRLVPAQMPASTSAPASSTLRGEQEAATRGAA